MRHNGQRQYERNEHTTQYRMDTYKTYLLAVSSTFGEDLRSSHSLVSFKMLLVFVLALVLNRGHYHQSDLLACCDATLPFSHPIDHHHYLRRQPSSSLAEAVTRRILTKRSLSRTNPTAIGVGIAVSIAVGVTAMLGFGYLSYNQMFGENGWANPDNQEQQQGLPDTLIAFSPANSATNPIVPFLASSQSKPITKQQQQQQQQPKQVLSKNQANKQSSKESPKSTASVDVSTKTKPIQQQEQQLAPIMYNVQQQQQQQQQMYNSHLESNLLYNSHYYNNDNDDPLSYFYPYPFYIYGNNNNNNNNNNYYYDHIHALDDADFKQLANHHYHYYQHHGNIFKHMQ